MIQRIQTIWWLFSISIMAAMIFMPLFQYSDAGAIHNILGKDINYIYGPLIGQSILTVIVILLFKRRRFQITLGYLIIANQLAVAFGIYAYYKAGIDTHPDLKVLPWVAFLLVAIIFQILAIRGVKNDEKLVRSMDRLR